MQSPTGRRTQGVSLVSPARGAFTPDFYDRDTARVARDLLGHELHVLQRGGVWWRARIVETEAYLGPDDPACHSAVGRTARNDALHGPPGTVYVYRIYGLHRCVNAVTMPDGVGAAVLIRAVEPLVVTAALRARRPAAQRDVDLTNGPGKVCAALAITDAHNGTSLQHGPVRIVHAAGVRDDDVRVSPRIGITQAADWMQRYVVSTSPYISRTPRAFPITEYRP
jgi:DNA-3-methyladenine glycosylase